MSLSVVLPALELNDWHRRLTDFSIENLRKTAENDFELIIVETCGRRLESKADVYIHRPERTTLSIDMNLGIDAATQPLVAHTANDLVMPKGWVSALIEPFDRKDCGASTLHAMTHRTGKIVGIEEGFYGPVLCYGSQWRFDADDFPGIFGDTDLVMRIYRAGLRCYRNWNVTVRHLGGGEQTYQDTMTRQDRQAAFLKARERFRQKHQECGLMMFRALYEGWRV